MSHCENFKPKFKEIYYSIESDGRVTKNMNVYDKSDLFSIMHSLCWDTPFIPKEERKKALELLQGSIENNKGD